MRFAKVALFSTVLALAPAAMASTIYGVIKVDGTGTNGGAAVNASSLAFNASPAPGLVLTGSSMAGVHVGDEVSYDPGDTNKSINFNKVSVSKPALLFVLGDYDIYITSVSNIVVGTNGTHGVPGSFTATGYITDDNGATKTPITVSWVSDTKGAGKVNFVATVNAANAQEPASLALLGTGGLATLGAVVRRRRTA